MEDEYITIMVTESKEGNERARWFEFLRKIQMTPDTFGHDLRVDYYYAEPGRGSTTVYRLRLGTAKRLGVPEWKPGSE